MTASLDFGATPCAATAAAQELTIQNTGGTAFTYSAQLGRGAASPFTVASPTGTVEPGATARLAVTPLAIPGTSAVPGNYGDAVTVTTNIPGDAAHTVALSQTAQGAILAFNLSSIPFGLTTVQTTKAQNFQVSNSGNAAAQVSFSAGAPFSASPATPTDVGAGMVLVAEAAFNAADTMLRTGTVTLQVSPTTVLCAPLPAPITVSGTGQNGGVSFDKANLDFGAVDCGTMAAPRTLVMTNNGNAPLAWSAELDSSDGFYTLTRDGGPLNGSLSMGASVTFTVASMGIPATSSTEADLYGSGITITTNVIGQSTYSVPILQSARGYLLAFDPSDLQFGNVPVNSTANAEFHVINAGNAPATITLTSSNTKFTTVLEGDTAPASGSVVVTATFAPGTSTTESTGAISITTGAMDVACGVLPADLTLTGTGTNGAVTYSPQSLNFGNTPCGTTAAAQQVTFSNTGNQAYTVTAALGKTGAGAPYVLAVTPSDGVVAAGGEATISITPAGIPATNATPGDFNDVLTVTTDVAGDMPHAINLSQNAYGAILGSPSTSSIMFNATSVNLSSTSTFAVPNTGNAPATLTFSNLNGVFTFENLVAAANSGANATARFSPAMAMQYSDTATMGVAAGTPLCAPLPAARTISLAGTGSAAQPTITVSPGRVDFGDTNCGAAAPGARTVTITNLQATPVNISSFLLTSDMTGDNGRYALSINRSTLAATGAGGGMDTAVITVTPKAIVVGPNTNFGTADWSDTLRIVSDATAGGTVDVALDRRAMGGFFARPDTLTVPDATPKTFIVGYLGNVPAAFTMANSNTQDFVLTANQGTMSAGGQTRQSTLAYNPRLLGANNMTAISFNVGASILCRPAPANIQVTGQ